MCVMRGHPSLSSICGNLYPALKKTDYGQLDLYPEFRRTSTNNNNNNKLVSSPSVKTPNNNIPKNPSSFNRSRECKIRYVDENGVPLTSFTCTDEELNNNTSIENAAKFKISEGSYWSYTFTSKKQLPSLFPTTATSTTTDTTTTTTTNTTSTSNIATAAANNANTTSTTTTNNTTSTSTSSTAVMTIAEPTVTTTNNTTSTSTIATAAANNANTTSTSSTAVMTIAEPTVTTTNNTTSASSTSSSNYIPPNQIAHTNTDNLLIYNDKSAEYYSYDFEDYYKKDYHRLDLANWTNDWGIVCELVSEEIRFNHYLEEIQLLNTSCGAKMSKILRDNVVLKRFLCPAKSEYSKLIETQKMKSFHFRVSLAVFLKGMGPKVQIGTIRCVLEYAVGSGPLVAMLMEKYVL